MNMNQKDKRNLFLGIAAVVILAIITFFVMVNNAGATGGWELTNTEYGECTGDCDSNEGTRTVTKTYEKHGFVCPEGYHDFGIVCEKDGPQFKLASKVWGVTDTKTEEETEDCYIEEPLVCEEPVTPPSPFSDGRSSNPDATKPFVCPTGDTTGVVANPHVWRNGTSATVNFFITEGNSAHIFWSVVGEPHWGNAVANVKPNGDNFVSYTVNDLDPNLGYDFGIQQVESCSGGKVTAVVVDGPEPQLFTLSYYE